MEKIYPRAEEKLVKNVVLYANASNVLYVDSAATATGATLDEVVNLFKKGNLIVSKGGAFYVPTKLATTTTVATVSLVDMVSSAATAVSFTSYVEE